MGITDLFKVVVHRKGEAENGKTIDELFKKSYTLTPYNGSTVVCDASNLIYRALKAYSSVNTLTDSEGNTTVHLNTIFSQLVLLSKHKINNFWMFDNPTPNSLKAAELEKRKKIKEASNNEKVKITMNSTHVKDIQELLYHMGITYMVAPPGIESEQIAARMTIPNSEGVALASYVLSGDADVLAFGGNLLRIGQVIEGGKSKKFFQAIDVGELLNKIGIVDNLHDSVEDEFLLANAKADFARICIYLGTDFNEKEPGIGPKTVMKKYAEGKVTMSEFQDEILSYFLLDFKDVVEKIEIKNSVYNREGVIAYLKKFGFNEDRVGKNLDTYEENK